MGSKSIVIKQEHILDWKFKDILRDYNPIIIQTGPNYNPDGRIDLRNEIRSLLDNCGYSDRELMVISHNQDLDSLERRLRYEEKNPYSFCTSCERSREYKQFKEYLERNDVEKLEVDFGF
jgi:hypothetical protein